MSSEEVFFKPYAYIDIPQKDLLSWTFDEVTYDEDKPIYIDASNESRSISSRQARVLIRQLAAGLRAAGLKKGDAVCLHSFNDIYYPIIFLGVIAAGGIWNGTNPAYTRYELASHIKISRSKFIIAEPESGMFKNITEAAAECGIQKERIFVFDVFHQHVPAGYQSWKSLLTHGEEDWIRFDDLEKCKSTTAALLFSSGTTGVPKAGTLSHHNFIAQHTLVHEQAKHPWEAKRLMALPFFHAASAPATHTSPLRAGTPTYIMRRFDLEGFLKNIEKYQITEMIAVPPVVIAIIMSPASKKYSLKSVRAVSIGAAPLDKDSQQRLLDLIGSDAKVTQVWGMTETSCVCTQFDWPEKDFTGSIGRLVANMEFKLVDDEDNNISAYGVRGEICVRGPLVIAGYLDNPKANAEAYKDGWFHTGDIAYCDPKSKKWYIVDRKKELIKVRGFQVAPPELEAVLLSHPQIIDAAVIGVYPRGVDGGEVPRAYVVRRPGPEGAKLTEADVKGYLEPRLAKYKALNGGVVFLEAIPKTASGKILKKNLRDQAKREMSSKL